LSRWFQSNARHEAIVGASVVVPARSASCRRGHASARGTETSDVTLRHAERRDRAVLSAHRAASRFSDPTQKTTDIELVLRGDVLALPMWFARLVKLTAANWAHCDVQRTRSFANLPERRTVPIGWLSLVPAAIAARYPFDKVTGDGVTLLRHDGATILVTAPTPAGATAERIAQVAARVRALA
jgi:hypothetical protein